MTLFLLISLIAAALGQTAPKGIWAYTGGSSISVYWNTVPGATSYNLYRSTTSNGQGTVPYKTALGTGYGDSDVTAGTRYYYKVTALFGSSESSKSVQVSAKPGSSLVGSPLVCAYAGDHSVTLKYSAVPNATFYRTFRYSTQWSWQSLGTTSSLSFTDPTAENGISYSYMVEPGNQDTEGQSSSTVYVVPGDSPAAAPTFPGATADSGYNTIAWNPVPGARYYAVFRGTSANSAAPKLIGQTGSNYFYDNTAVTGATYYYSIATVDWSGTSPSSVEASVKTGSTKLQAGLLSGVAGEESVSLTWQPTKGATTYYVVRSPGIATNSIEVIQKVTTTTYNDNAVLEGATYTYSVIPASPLGAGINSNQVRVKVGASSPIIPKGLYAISGTTSITIYWNSIPTASYYAIYRGTTGTPQLYAFAGGAGYTDENVVANAKYTYRVSAVFSNNQSPWSDAATGTISRPQLPGPKTTVVSGSEGPTVYWNLVTGATSYNVFRLAEGRWEGYAFNIVPGAGSTSGAFTDLKVPSNDNVTYQVFAVNSTGMGVGGNQVSVNNGSAPPPAPRATLAFGGAGYNYIYTDWVPNVSCNVYRSTTPGGQGSVPYAIGVGHEFTDVIVTAGVVYYYKFTAYDNDGQSLRSPECSADPKAAPLAAPRLTIWASQTENLLHWSPVVNATSYTIMRSSDNGEFTIYQSGVTDTTFVDSNVSASRTYYYYIYPVRLQGAGSRSNTVSARPNSPTPRMTDGIYAVPGTSVNQVQWNPVPGDVTYNVYRSYTSGGQGLVPIATGIGGTSFTDSTVGTSVQYYYVTAVSCENQGNPSAEVTSRKGTARLASPSLQGNFTTGQVALSWNKIPKATSYNLFRWDPVRGWILYQQGLKTTTFTDLSVTHGVEYSYSVAPVQLNGMGDYSNTVGGRP